jgi:hypothetical protein
MITGSGLPVLNAAYIIKLMNGKEYVTARYWHERGQLFFDTHGGTFGIDKGFVTKIEKTNQIMSLADRMSGFEQGATSPTAEQRSKDQYAEEREIKQTKTAQAETGKEPLKKDDEVLKQYQELQKRFGQLNDLPKHEVHALEADIQSFREKISNGELAEAHKEENAAMGTLLRAIASYLKASYP